MVSLTEASNDRPPFGARPSVRTALDFSSALASHGTARSANQAAACAAFQIALSSQTAAAEPMQAAAFTGTCIINIQPEGGSERANTDALVVQTLTFESLLPGVPQICSMCESARCAQENPSPFRWLIGVGENLIDDRNVAQKYVWRAEIVLFTAGGAGTNEIMRRTCKSKQDLRLALAGTLLGPGVRGSRSATRPGPRGSSRSMARRLERVRRPDGLAIQPGETTHWTGVLMAKASGLSVSSVQRIWRGHGLQPHRVSPVQAFERPTLR